MTETYREIEFEALAEAVKSIARRAGEAILEVYEKPENFEVELKSDHSPLTRADRASNQIINEGLKKLSWQFPIVSEENQSVPFEKRKHFETYWLVDPLDGTKEFIKRNGDFTINIALVENGAPVFGVVFVPFWREMYWGGADEGAYFQKGDGAAEPIGAAHFSLRESGLKIVCSRSHLDEATRAMIEKFDRPEMISRGSALKFLLLAKGEAHLYPRFGPTMEWDTAAAQIILEEAGGQLLQMQNRKPLVYNKPDLLNPPFLAMAAVTD